MPEFDLRTMTLTFDCDYDGEEDLVTVPAKFVICGTCRGKGQHSLAVDGHGITSEEWDRDWSFEEQQAYMSGEYDQPCEVCKGTGKVAIPDWDKLDAKTAERIEEWYRLESEFQAMSEAERRMGA